MNEEFQKLYVKYRHEIYMFILKLVRYNKDLAEELTQETFYQTFLSLHRYRGECEVKSWICQIAKNTCFKYFKKNPIHISIDSEEYKEVQILDVEKDIEELFLNNEMKDYIYKSVQKLKPKYRDVMIYRLFLEMHFNTIGQIMHISENSAKVIYFRGKNLLKVIMEEFGYGR